MSGGKTRAVMSEPVPGLNYCLTNEHMPGLVKIGRTTNIEQRIADLSRPTGVPGTFVLEFAKYVTNTIEKERQLHSILSEKRVEGSEFFKATPEEVRALFALMEGEWVTPVKVTPVKVTPVKVTPVKAAPVKVTAVVTSARIAPVKVVPVKVVPVKVVPVKVVPVKVVPVKVAYAPKKQKQWTKKPHPELYEILEDGQHVSHKIKKGTEWTPTFSSELNKIIYNGVAYTLNELATTHYKQEDPDRNPACNAWKEIKTMVDGQMISLEKLERIKAQPMEKIC